MAVGDYVTICSNKNCNMQYLYAPNSTDKKNICDKCRSSLIHTTITGEEMFLIRRTSRDKDFIMAMIQLKDENIIEYKSRIAQWREDAKRAGCYGKKEQLKYNTQLDNYPKCPTCGSTNIQKITAGQKALGAIGFGLLSKTARSTFKCNNCGHKW